MLIWDSGGRDSCWSSRGISGDLEEAKTAAGLAVGDWGRLCALDADVVT